MLCVAEGVCMCGVYVCVCVSVCVVHTFSHHETYVRTLLSGACLGFSGVSDTPHLLCPSPPVGLGLREAPVPCPGPRNGRALGPHL